MQARIRPPPSLTPSQCCLMSVLQALAIATTFSKVLAIRQKFAQMLLKTVFDARLAGALRLDVRHACFSNWVSLFGPYR